MPGIDEEDEMFIPPKYVVSSFLCSVNDDDSQLEVRRYANCFYITMAPENFANSPDVKQQYLHYLAAERSDAIDDDNIAETTLQRTFILGPLSLIEGRGVGMVDPGLELDNSAFCSAWPTFMITDIEICMENPEDAIFASPNKVLVCGTGVCFFKFYQSDDINLALRELKAYRQISESNLDPGVHISRLQGIVKDDRNRLIGLLLTYIDCGFLTLACAVLPDIPPSTKQKWVDQVTGILMRLHEAGIVWGDAKPENVLIDKNDDAWIIDFGGGYTRGFVEEEAAGTIDGDLQGLEKIVEYIFSQSDG